MKDEDARLDEALAGGTLGGPHYDEIFERILARTASAEVRSRPRWSRWGLFATAALVPAAAAWLVVARPHVSAPTPKGADGVNGAIEVGCGAGGRVCRQGDTLMFAVNAATATGYLGAYAERIGDAVPERIWYFPAANGQAPMVSAAQGTIVLPEGIQIGPEHAPGRYRVTAWLAEQPPTRAPLDAQDVAAPPAAATFEIEVTP